MESFKEYITSKLFLKNLGLSIGALCVILILVMIYLRIYTHHGRSVTVPDFSNYSIEEAKRVLKDRKLNFEIFDSMYISARDKGVIIDQHPEAGSQVKKGRIVFFTINANSPEKMFMPDLVGITIREARARIESSGLRLGKLSYRYDMAKNVVLEQKFKGKVVVPGDTIFKGSEVDLVLGKGLSDEKAMVPNLRGLTVDEAKNRASDAFFSLGEPIHDESFTDPEIEEGIIYRQHPIHNPNILVQLGTPISVWVTLDTAKINSPASEDTTLIWENLNETNDVENVEDDSYGHDYSQP